MNQSIRLAATKDSESILDIYRPYIEHTAITFENEVPCIHEFAKRIDKIAQNYPFLVYVIQDKVVGYAYASRHAERAAYHYDVNVSIYVEEQFHGTGISSQLYTCLFHILKECGYHNAYAAITVPNEKSRIFHEKFGFTLIGTHHKTGFKLGKWHDVAWFEKTIKEHIENPQTIKAIDELPVNGWEDLLLSICGG